MSDGHVRGPAVITLGETMVALVAEDMGPLRHVSRYRRKIAGAESNVAVGLSRLGVRTGWISRLGDDEFGRHIHTTLRGEGLDLSQVAWDSARPTGLMIKELRSAGKSRVYYYRAGSAASALSSKTLHAPYLRQARHIHLTGITPALSPGCAEAALYAARTVIDAGGTLSFDLNLRSQLGVSDPLALFTPFIDLAHTFLLGLDEAQQFFGTRDSGAIRRELAALDVPTVVLKLGAEGASAYTAGTGEWQTAPGYRVPVVDEVGAGDAFAAAYLASLLRGLPVEERLRMANAAGALAVTVPGDVEGLAEWDELEAFAVRPGGAVER